MRNLTQAQHAALDKMKAGEIYSEIDLTMMSISIVTLKSLHKKGLIDLYEWHTQNEEIKKDENGKLAGEKIKTLVELGRQYSDNFVVVNYVAVMPKELSQEERPKRQTMQEQIDFLKEQLERLQEAQSE